MKRVTRGLKRHFGVSAKHVLVRSQRPWYWRPLVMGLLILSGYLIGYWQFAGGEFGSLISNLERMARENQSMQAKIVQGERQLQVERAAQNTLAKELAGLQDEDMHLKEDVAFYRSILNENPGASELKFHSFKLSKGAQENQYDYHILLVQSGRHDKIVQGNLKLILGAMQAGKPVTLPLDEGTSSARAIQINFKYYQRIDGSFIVPSNTNGRVVEASFIATGANQPKISQRVDLPS
jgi:hypothetical protein